MADLIKKFFNEDLSRAERAALKDELGSSEESVIRFAAQAEEAYKKFGLPEPEWTGPESLSERAKPRWGWKLGLTGLLAVIVGSWFWWSGKHQVPVMETQLSVKEEKPIDPAPVKHRNPVGKVEEIKTKPVLQEKKESPKSVVARLVPTKAPALLPPVQNLKPIDLQAEPHRTYSSLSVEIKWPTRRDLVVKVLNAEGSEVTLLYQGPLDAGLWVFDWNGKFVDGRPAPAGTYQIEVKSGTMMKRKAIQIK